MRVIKSSKTKNTAEDNRDEISGKGSRKRAMKKKQEYELRPRPIMVMISSKQLFPDRINTIFEFPETMPTEERNRRIIKRMEGDTYVANKSSNLK